MVSADGSKLYVAAGRSGLVVAIDTTTGKPVGQVAVGARPWGLALSPDGSTLYSANGSSNDVTAVDVASLQVKSRIAAGESPWGVVIGPWPLPAR